MRRFAFLLRPSWLILALLVGGFAYLCFSVLAPWQLGKNTDTERRNQLITDSVQAEPVPLNTLLDGAADAPAEWRRVRAHGHYLPGTTAVVRLRHLDGAPAYAVLAAFQLHAGPVVLVDRGLVAAAGGADLPAIEDPPMGPQRIQGRIRGSELVDPDKPPHMQAGLHQVYAINTDQAAEVLAQPITPIPTGDQGGYLQLSAEQPGAFTPAPLPQLESGPYLSYGLQWLAFGLMAPLGLGYFMYAEIRARRVEKTANAEAEHTTPTDPPPAPADRAAARLTDRYGGSRN